MGFFEAAFYTVTMILDAGCIQFVIADIGTSGITIAVICLSIIVIGMVSFTGAVIGYVTNTISSFIDNSNSGVRKLRISNHLVVLNWNTRASEIINDLLYCRGNQKVVVLVEGRKQEIIKEIDERLSDTIRKENNAIHQKCRSFGFWKRRKTYRKEKLSNNITFVVREGDVFSSKQLHDISLENARSVVILGSDAKNTETEKGNAQTIKTLMQVSDITAAAYSADNQKIIVEISDDWTWEIVQRIIKYKQVDGKCNIVPIRANRILGHLLSQISLMPELNLAYRELFSNKGITFYVEEKTVKNEQEYIFKYLNTHKNAIPLTQMEVGGKRYFYYSAEEEKDIKKSSTVRQSGYAVQINRRYWIEKKNVIILGHNSKCRDIMRGFDAFRNEWNYKDGQEEILQIVVIDDRESLEKMNYYKDYPFVIKTVAASIYEKDLICSTIEEFVDSKDEDTSVLILSDDSAPGDSVDANALANLVYVQDIITKKKNSISDFDPESIDIIVEIIDPRHHDIVSSYSVNNVVISNRYISKMITQIGEKEAIFEFYADILTYDEESATGYQSKEVYSKKVSAFFDEIPAECSEEEFIRAVWNSSVDPSVPQDQRNPTIALGYVKPGGNIRLFGGDQSDTQMRLESRDKVIVFTNH
ncbi:MAG: hypothetical protein IJU41_00885 [Clostridia bacterium]|nr:hypothetical protein [Clostridia bacterium]